MRISRKQITEAIQRATIGYYTKKNFGVNVELGVMPWGRRRVDVVAVNRKGHIVICELKSNKQDFVSDKKFLEYLPFCNQMYIVIYYQDLKWMEDYLPTLKKNGIGVHILSENGLLVNHLRAPNRKMMRKTKREILLRLAWRNAKFSKCNTKRVRVFVREANESV